VKEDVTERKRTIWENELHCQIDENENNANNGQQAFSVRQIFRHAVQ
jgi:hypothetical protein